MEMQWNTFNHPGRTLLSSCFLNTTQHTTQLQLLSICKFDVYHAVRSVLANTELDKFEALIDEDLILEPDQDTHEEEGKER